MKKYIGTKIIQAEPAKRFLMPDGSKVIASVNEIVAYETQKEATACEDGYKVRYSDGYDSFSPKEAFEEAYRRTDNMNFGLALEAAKKGLRVARTGWNGRGMYVFLADVQEMNTAADISEFENQDVEISKLLVLRTAQETLQPGWLATQSDMLADDWYIVEQTPLPGKPGVMPVKHIWKCAALIRRRQQVRGLPPVPGGVDTLTLRVYEPGMYVEFMMDRRLLEQQGGILTPRVCSSPLWSEVKAVGRYREPATWKVSSVGRASVC